MKHYTSEEAFLCWLDAVTQVPEHPSFEELMQEISEQVQPEICDELWAVHFPELVQRVGSEY